MYACKLVKNIWLHSARRTEAIIASSHFGNMLLVHAWHSKLSAVSLLDAAIFLSLFIWSCYLVLIAVSVGMMSRSSSAHLPLLLQLVVVFNELFSKTLVGGYESLRPARFLTTLAMLMLPMKILTRNACFWDIFKAESPNCLDGLLDRHLSLGHQKCYHKCRRPTAKNKRSDMLNWSSFFKCLSNWNQLSSNADYRHA